MVFITELANKVTQDQTHSTALGQATLRALLNRREESAGLAVQSMALRPKEPTPFSSERLKPNRPW